MNCKECRYLLFDYVDGKLSLETKQVLNEHIEQCPDCANRLEEMQNRQQALEENSGLFFYLLKPSGGHKRMFFAGAVSTIVLFVILTYLHFNDIIF